MHIFISHLKLNENAWADIPERQDKFSVSHCEIQKPQCEIHISQCGIQIPHCKTENLKGRFTLYNGNN